MPPNRIVLVGATGYTGRLVARELARGDAPFLLTARDGGRLTALAAQLGGAATAVVDVRRRESLDAVLRPGDVVASTAGPFTDLGEPVLLAAIRNGAHYLDTTGEQDWMHTMERRHGRAARDAGIAVVHAMAFEYALGDAAAAIAADGLGQPLRSVDVLYAGQGSGSRGTRRSVLLILDRAGWIRRDGALSREPTGARRREVRLSDGRTRQAVSFPAGEVLHVPRHVDVRDVTGWIVVGGRLGRLLPPLAPTLPALVRIARPLLEWRLRQADDGPDREQGRRSSFTITVDAVDGDGSRRSVVVEGRDPYGVTATILVAGAQEALGGAAPAGYLAPSQLVAPRRLLNALQQHGVEHLSRAH